MIQGGIFKAAILYPGMQWVTEPNIQLTLLAQNLKVSFGTTFTFSILKAFR